MRNNSSERYVSTSVLALILGAAVARGQDPSPDYPDLYTEHSDSQSLNVEVTRGMVLTPSGFELFAINSYASSLVRYDFNGLPPALPTGELPPNDVWPTLVDPVAVALHDGDVLVLGQGTHGIARHDAVTGRILDIFVPAGLSEPADLVVDEQTGEAYVSCMGSDCVVRLDLSGPRMVEIERWVSPAATPGDFQLKRPRFLHWTGSELYVAPFLAGNNTYVVGTLGHSMQPDSVGNGLDPSVIYDAYADPQVTDLPDVDLWRITPGPVPAQGPPPPATIEAIFRDAGTLQTGHGIDPATGDYWMLGIDSLNTSFDTEPALKGRFARNTAMISALPIAPPEVVTAAVIDLDQPGAGYHPDDSLPFPWALEFGGPNGMVAVASSTLSRIALLDGNGSRVTTIPPASGSLHEGKVVRDLLFRGTDLLVYCQQTSNILVWRVHNGVPDAGSAFALSLLSDPTSDGIARGREIFYDASRSKDSRFTCGTCHPGGDTDALAWNLKDGVRDFKDPMVTQPLRGLRETFPYHWRGERELSDFNGAFVGLLGASAPLATDGDPVELDDFEAFVFSLRPPANPHELLGRQIPAFVDVPGSPVGQGDARDAAAIFATENCNQCHMLPTGSVGSIQPDSSTTTFASVAWNANIETIQLSNFQQAREQPLVTVTVPDVAGTGTVDIQRPLLGAGFLHSGSHVSLFDFLRDKFGTVFHTDQDTGGANASAFVMSMDTGTPPAAHHAILFDRNTWSTAQAEIESVLLDQAQAGWIDVVVHGTSPHPQTGLLEDYSWTYDPLTERFVPDATGADSPGNRKLGWFKKFHLYPDRRNVFFGVLLGTGERLGRDFDRDGIVNRDEPGLARWNRDRDGDGHPDGHEADNGGTQDDPDSGPTDTTPPGLVNAPDVLMVRATHGQLTFETDVDVTWRLDLSDLTGTYTLSATGAGFGRRHTAHAHGMRPGESEHGLMLIRYNGTLTLTDRGGNTTIVNLPGLFITERDTGGFVSIGARVEVEELGFPNGAGDESYNAATSEYTATVRVKVDDHEQLFSNPVGNWTVIAQALRQDVSSGEWEAVPTAEIAHDGANGPNADLDNLWDGTPYPVTSGHFIALSPTDDTMGPDPGAAQVTFTVQNVAPGQPVAFNIVAVLDASENNGTPADPNYALGAFRRWVMPATQDELRMFVGNVP